MLSNTKLLSTIVLLLFGLLLVASVSPVAAAPVRQSNSNPDITLTAEAGFDGLRKGLGWFPIQITAANNGPAVEGELRVFTGNDRPTFSTPISLPTQSNKRVTIEVYLPLNNSRLEVQLVDEIGQEVAAVATNTIKTLDSDSFLFGVITPDPDSLDFLDSITTGRAETGVAFLTVEALPDNPLAWTMLDVLIINNVDSSQFSAGQLSALEDWVQSGGQFVITGGPNWQQTTAAFSDWLPVTPGDTTSVDDLPALSERFSEPFRDPGPYVVTTSSLRAGQLLLREENLPILARRPLGRGSVFFLALDPQFAPLADWDGSPKLWREISKYAPRTPVWGTDFRNEDRAGNAVENLPTLSLPSPALFFLFIGAYIIIIGPLNYMVLSRRNRREWAWVTIPATIVLFSVIAFLTGIQFKGNRVIINQMSIVYGQIGNDESRVQTAVGLYSPRRGEYDLVFNDAPWVRPLQSFGFSNRPLTIATGTNTTIKELLVDVSDVSAFSTVKQQPMPTINGEAVIVEKGSGLTLDISVTNNLTTPLEFATLLIGDDSVALGTLAPGQTQTISKAIISTGSTRNILNTAAGLQSFVPATTALVSSPLEKHYNALLGTATYYYNSEPIVRGRYQLLESFGEPYGAPSAGWVPQGTVTLVGWTDEPQVNIELNSDRFDVSASTVYFLEIPYQP